MTAQDGPRRVSRRRFPGAGLATGAVVAGRPPRAGALAAALPVGTPKRGGTLFGAQEVDPISLDPHTNSNLSALQGYEHAYEGLTTYDERMNDCPRPRHALGDQRGRDDIHLPPPRGGAIS